MKRHRPTEPIALPYGGRFDPATDTLYCGHNAGFFSNCTVTLWHMVDLYRRFQIDPRRIDFSSSFGSYRTEAERQAKTDLYPLFFALGDSSVMPHEKRAPNVKHHGLYRFVDYRSTSAWVDRYFNPSVRALALQDRLIQQYAIDVHKTIAVAYRGTDKGSEVKLADPEKYLQQARTLLVRNPGFRVWIQTDEQQVRDLFTASFGERCFYIKELPPSVHGIAADELPEGALHASDDHLGVLLVAIFHLLSGSAYVVNHTGNMALWICLFRGSANGVIQFDEGGHIVDLASPGFYLGRGRVLFGKVRRRLATITPGFAG
jgi:hypothetical protein